MFKGVYGEFRCPLCLDNRHSFFIWKNATREYWHCLQCDLRYLAPQHRLSPSRELQHYMQHKNDPQDLKYREFLRPAFDVVVSQEPVGSRGLDYGSGPGSALAAMLAEAQYQVRLYDPFFHPKAEPEAEPTVVFGERKYDFIVCTEAAEHFHEPKNELQRMHSLLKPGGLLVMMTLLCKSSENFGQWYYTVDPTHVVFYSETTCQWIKQNLNFKTVDIVSERLVVFSS